MSEAFPGGKNALSVDRHVVVGFVCRWEVSGEAPVSLEDIDHSVTVLVASIKSVVWHGVAWAGPIGVSILE